MKFQAFQLAKERQAVTIDVRIAEMFGELAEIQPPPHDSSPEDSQQEGITSDELPFDEDSELPPPKQYASSRIASTPSQTSLTRKSSWNNLELSNDLASIKSEVESKLRAHSMPNLFSSRSSHNRIMGISVLISEQETGNGREKEKRIARVEEFEEFLGQL